MNTDYSKYYALEDYLFNEVRENFHRNGFLSPEEFFCIIIWKANRAKSKILRRLIEKRQNLNVTIKMLTSEIAKCVNNYDRLNILLNNWHFRLPMASAILTVLYPKDFTIYDVRVCNELGIIDFAGTKSQSEQYFDVFLPKVEKIRKDKSLRENDKYLWGKSFYQDLKHFLMEKN